MEDSEAATSLSTIHVGPEPRPVRLQPGRANVQHAVVVLNRVIRSPDKRDRMLHDRISRAAGVVRATDATETAMFASSPTDVVYRLASRIVRGLGGKISRR